MLSTIYRRMPRFGEALRLVLYVVVCAASLSSSAIPASADLLLPQQDIKAALKQVGDVYDRGDYSAAAKLAQAGVDQARAAGDPADCADFLLVLGRADQPLTDFPDALAALNEAVSIYKTLGNERGEGNALNSLGNVYTDMDEFDRSIVYYSDALALRRKIGDPVAIAATLNNLGIIYHDLSEYDRSIECYEQALALDRGHASEAIIAMTTDNMANSYDYANRRVEALKLHRQALRLFLKVDDPISTAFSYNNIATSLETMAKDPATKPAQMKRLRSEAIADELKAYDLLMKASDPRDALSSLENLGSDYDDGGDQAQALAYYDKALAQATAWMDIAEVHSDIGAVLIEQKRYDEARNSYDQAIDVIEREESRVLDPGTLGSFETHHFGSIYSEYAWLIGCQQHQPLAGLLLAERGRAQGLSRQAAICRANMDGMLSATDSASLRAAKNTSALAAAHARVIEDNSDHPEKDPLVVSAHADTNRAEHEYEIVRDGIYARYPEFQQVSSAEPPTGADLESLAAAHSDTLYLEYAAADSGPVVFMLRAGRSEACCLLPKPKHGSLADLCSKWTAAITGHTILEPQLAVECGRVFLQPVFADPTLAAGIRHIVFVLDSSTAMIPLAALIVPNTHVRLIERYSVVDAISLGVLTWPKPEYKAGPLSLFCAADPSEPKSSGMPGLETASRGGYAPLKYARVEAEAVADLFRSAVLKQGGTVKVLLGAAATEPAVVGEMPKYSVLHFATHGFFDAGNGLRSWLLLATDDPAARRLQSIDLDRGGAIEGSLSESGGSGKLEARDIASMQLNARLAVLSACTTALGQPSGGDGLVGLAWAFRAAGVPSVVASRWSVDDQATSRLMRSFYASVLKGCALDDALRHAMLEVKLSHPDPFYWSAFTVTGDTQPLVKMRP